jgi:hypothetical protein
MLAAERVVGAGVCAAIVAAAPVTVRVTSLEPDRQALDHFLVRLEHHQTA